MSTVRIWDLNSDYDAISVKRMTEKLSPDLQPAGPLTIRTAHKKGFLIRKGKGKTLSNTLRKAIHHYLEQDDYVIFVADSNSPTQTHPQPRASAYLINHIDQVVRDNIFDGKVFLARGVQELKAGLPIVHKFLGSRSSKWQEEWNSAVAPFHDAFANTPEDEVVQNLDETLAEVRRERT
ncbi:MAG: hypothetical protein OXP71_11865 [Candidatus Poribacteria bacterium]|nr:hypothetical protein [Candidatus Poribacteria bacterium]